MHFETSIKAFIEPKHDKLEFLLTDIRKYNVAELHAILKSGKECLNTEGIILKKPTC